MANKFKDETGNTYGRLTVIEYAGSKNNKTYWRCQCLCGNIVEVSANKLRTHRTKSCGCLQKEHRHNGNINRKHGESKTRLYVLWSHMKDRCSNPKNIMYKSYGGRGVKYCKEWERFEDFQTWATNNGYQDGLSLERIDVNGNYEPQNCKWILPMEQHWNLRRSHRVTAFGKTQTIGQWALETGIKYDTIERRINAYGWSAEDAVSIKPKRKR